MASAKDHGKARSAITCPKCHRDVQRIGRNLFDKILGIIVPVRRYKCYGCFWEGIRIHHHHSSNKAVSN